jgi:pyrroline-5-carboxylate reductase
MRAFPGRVAIVGFGSMGGMLARGFLGSASLDPANLSIAARSPRKAASFLEKWPDAALAPDPAGAVRGADIAFLCVKPQDARTVLAEIGPVLGEKAHLASIVGSLSLGDLESATRAAVSVVMPSVCAEVGAGATILCHGARVGREAADSLETLLSGLGAVRAVREAELHAWSELASCGPGLLSAMLGEFLGAVVRKTGLPRADAESLWKETVFGTAKLLRDGGLGFDEVLSRVATPGGITEAGASVLRGRLPALFDEMLDRMEKRRAERDARMRSQPGR